MIPVDRLRTWIYGRRFAYNQVFKGPYGERVLADLMQFCRAHESTFHENDRVAANLDGRREVWLRIQQHLRLSPDELFDVTVGQAETDKQHLTKEVEGDG